MTEKLDDFLQELQDRIIEDAVRDYGKTVVDRWRNPLFMYAMDNPDGYGVITGPCGDTMAIFLTFENDRVKGASFQTDGCGSSIVCGSFAAELALGKKIKEVEDISNETILQKIGGLPEEDRHCALLAANTLRQAVDSYTCGKHNPNPSQKQAIDDNPSSE